APSCLRVGGNGAAGKGPVSWRLRKSNEPLSRLRRRRSCRSRSWLSKTFTPSAAPPGARSGNPFSRQHWLDLCKACDSRLRQLSIAPIVAFLGGRHERDPVSGRSFSCPVGCVRRARAGRAGAAL